MNQQDLSGFKNLTGLKSDILKAIPKNGLFILMKIIGVKVLMVNCNVSLAMKIFNNSLIVKMV